MKEDDRPPTLARLERRLATVLIYASLLLAWFGWQWSQA